MRRIRVLMVLGDFGLAGAESYVMNILRNIDYSLFQVDLAVTKIAKGALYDEICSYGCEIFYLPQFKVFNIIKCYRFWKSFFRQEHFDIIHGHASNSAAVYLRAAKKCGIKTIVHSHSAGYRGGLFERSAKSLFARRAKNYADMWCACSEKAAQRLFGSSYVNNPKYIELPNAINTDSFLFSDQIRKNIREKYDIKEDVKVYGHVGSFSYPKNHTFIIDIFNIIQKKDKNAKLLLCGDGILKKEIESKVAELNIDGSVIFAGIVTNVNEYLMAMDALVFPSHFEGLPVSIVEAQATGLPVLMSDSITKEVIVTNIVKTKSLKSSASDWADSLLETKVDCRERYNKVVGDTYFNMRTSIQQIMSIYNSLACK